MVDWKAVEQLHARGWTWDRIAADPSVAFRPEGDPDPGGTLRARYYRRASTPALDAPDGTLPDPPPPPATRRPRVLRAGMLLTPLFGVWAILAAVAPSPVGAYLGAVPILGLLVAVSAGLLLFGLWGAGRRWAPAYRRTVAIGLVVGLATAGTLGAVAAVEGCPYLTPWTTGAPGGWLHAGDAVWRSGGAPELFFFGSAACPYCSASSWAIEAALLRMGPVVGTTFGASSGSDVYPHTPEVILADLSVTSPYVALNIHEGTDQNQISVRAPDACIEQGYLSAYDPSGTIPFVVVGGVYMHTTSLVDPSQLAGVSAASLQQQVSNESGPQWGAIAPQAYLLMAMLVHFNGGAPAAVAQIPQVAADLAQLG